MTDIVTVKPKKFGDLKVGDVFTLSDNVALVKTDQRDVHCVANAVRLSSPPNVMWKYEIGNDTVVFLPTEINVVF